MRRAGYPRLSTRGGVRKGKRLGPRRTIVEVLHIGRGIFDTARVRFDCGHEGRTWAGRSAPMPGAKGHCRQCIPPEVAAP